MNIPYVFKKCSKCGRWLVANTVNFNKKKYGKYGLHSWCKECVCANSKKWNEEHKEEKRERDKKYRKEHKETIAKQMKNYYEKHKEELAEYYKKYYKTPQGQVIIFNGNNRRRQREEQQGNGITKDQWLEMMNFFNWECAYSGISVSIKKNRSIDHIIPIVKGGEHEIWNCVPMDRSLNSSKHDKDMPEWYFSQNFFDFKRLDKIFEWCMYAYNKWGKK